MKHYITDRLDLIKLTEGLAPGIARRVRLEQMIAENEIFTKCDLVNCIESEAVIRYLLASGRKLGPGGHRPLYQAGDVIYVIHTIDGSVPAFRFYKICLT